MASPLAIWNIEIDVVAKGIKDAEKRLNSLRGAFRSLSSGSSTLVGTFAKLTAGYLSFQGAMRGSQFIFDTIAGFDSLTATLRTLNGEIEGSSFPKAEAEFERIRQVALDTPFTVEKVGQAFAQMKARGIDMQDVEGVMTSVGNTAAAFGQDITSFANAIGQAISGENERLKQFGIGAKVEGKKVTFSYKGMTKTVNRDIKSISDTLLEFGSEKKGEGFMGQFAGGARLQAETLGGAFSRLQDLVQIFVFELGRSGLKESLVGIINDIREMASGADNLAKRLGATIGASLKKLWGSLKDLPAQFEKAKKAVIDFHASLPAFMQVDNLSEGINRLSAALALIAANAAIPKIMAFASGIAGMFAGMTVGAAVIAIAKFVAIAAILFLVIDDIITWVRGGDSFFKRLWQTIESVDSGPLDALKDLFGELADIGMILWEEVLKPLGEYLGDVLPIVFRGLVPVVSDTITTVGLLFETIIRGTTYALKFLKLLGMGIAGIFGADYGEGDFLKVMQEMSDQASELGGSFGEAWEQYGSNSDKRRAAISELFAGMPAGQNVTPINAASGGIMAGGGGLGNRAAPANVSATTNANITVVATDPAAAGTAVRQELESRESEVAKSIIATNKAVNGSETA